MHARSARTTLLTRLDRVVTGYQEPYRQTRSSSRNSSQPPNARSCVKFFLIKLCARSKRTPRWIWIPVGLIFCQSDSFYFLCLIPTPSHELEPNSTNNTPHTNPYSETCRTPALSRPGWWIALTMAAAQRPRITQTWKSSSFGPSTNKST